MPIVLQITAMTGLGALLYPEASDWFASLHHDSEISGYVRRSEALPPQVRADKRDLARSYNEHLPAGVLRDPFRGTRTDVVPMADAAFRAYRDVLSVSSQGVIGRLSYPRLGISLPIYPGTDDEVLGQGVGHLYGSSLPVGGPSTHAVLTSHSGLVHASLFTALPRARVGDLFEVAVLGDVQHYQVRELRTVLPDETETLQIVPGEDWVTLFTCTPIGINSHRLLVHAARVDAPAGDLTAHAVAGDGQRPGFPWWAAGFAGGSLAIGAWLFIPPRRPDAPSAAREGAGEASG
ncbi:MAG: class C sortase [Propioniciclava sp.]|uniref:class C sortase n=1 Tax=Propioniciclava sp. TaxID=2038686 RepID=UPI0039E667B0